MNLERAIDIANTELKKKKIKSSLLDCEILMSKAINNNREFINPGLCPIFQEIGKDSKIVPSKMTKRKNIYKISLSFRYNLFISDYTLIIYLKQYAHLS